MTKADPNCLSFFWWFYSIASKPARLIISQKQTQTGFPFIVFFPSVSSCAWYFGHCCVHSKLGVAIDFGSNPTTGFLSVHYHFIRFEQQQCFKMMRDDFENLYKPYKRKTTTTTVYFQKQPSEAKRPKLSVDEDSGIVSKTLPSVHKSWKQSATLFDFDHLFTPYQNKTRVTTVRYSDAEKTGGALTRSQAKQVTLMPEEESLDTDNEPVPGPSKSESKPPEVAPADITFDDTAPLADETNSEEPLDPINDDYSKDTIVVQNDKLQAHIYQTYHRHQKIFQ